MTVSDGKLKITIRGEVHEVELFEITLGGIPIVVVADPAIPPGEARVVGPNESVRITGIGDTPTA
jgi:hypothetical protein